MSVPKLLFFKFYAQRGFPPSLSADSLCYVSTDGSHLRSRDSLFRAKKSHIGLDLARGPCLENVTACYVDTRAETEPFGPEEEAIYRNPI